MCVDSGKIRLVHLYPDLMSVYGDRGNVLTLIRRAEWRGIAIQVQLLSVGDSLDSRRITLSPRICRMVPVWVTLPVGADVVTRTRMPA